MKPKMNEKQVRALSCLDELTAYAKENKLPMRIMDELEDCRQQLSCANVDWTAVHLTMEDLLNSIEQKVQPQTVRKTHDENEISVDMVKEQIEKKAERCRADNSSSIDSMTKQKNTIIKANCGQLTDISRTEAHIEELKNENLYLQFFENCKNRYERDSFEMLREFLQSIDENYNHMMNHMRSMFQSIDGYKSGVGNKKFYYEYEERRSGISQRIQGEIQTADIGGSDILSLGQATLKKVKAIVKKLIRKRKLLAWLPIFILLALLAAGTCGILVVTQNKNTQVEAATDTQSDDSFWNTVLDKGESLRKMFDLANAEETAPSSSLSIGLLFVVVIIITVYALYINILRKRCSHQICKQCGEYLKTELLQFEQTNELSSKLDAAMESAAEEYERQYMSVLNNLFQNSQYYTDNTAQTDAISKFDALRAEWDHVRNL